MRITVACPETLCADANQLAMVLAMGAADVHTYDRVAWIDGSGNAYACVSFPALPEWIADAQTALNRPDWDTEEIIDMEAAARAQAAMTVWAYVEAQDAPKATPDVITAIVGMDGREAIAAMGLSVIEQSL